MSGTSLPSISDEVAKALFLSPQAPKNTMMYLGLKELSVEAAKALGATAADRLEAAIQKMPSNYRKLVRLGAYGSFIQYYICGLSFRATDLQGRTVVFPWIKQETGRCTEPDA